MMMKIVKISLEYDLSQHMKDIVINLTSYFQP